MQNTISIMLTFYQYSKYMHYNSIIHIDSLQNICSTRPVISLLVQSKLHRVLALGWFIN